MKRDADLLSVYQRKAEMLKLELRSLSEREAELIRKQEEHSSLLSQLNALKEFDIDNFRKEIENNRNILERFKERRTMMRDLDEKLRMLEKADENISRFSSELLQLREQQKRIDGRYILLKDSYERYQSFRKEHDELKQKEQLLLVRFSELNKEAEGIKRLADMLSSEITAKKRAEEQFRQLGGIQSWLEDYFLKLMATMEKHVMFRVYEEFNSLFTRWFGMLVEDELLTARLSDTFTPVMEQNGYAAELDSLSGGEKTAVALAYRLALNKVINDVVSTIKTKDIIVLDEPTDGFSTEQLDKVQEVLALLNMKQTIIVSHESKVESFVDNVIRVTKSGHVSSTS